MPLSTGNDKVTHVYQPENKSVVVTFAAQYHFVDDAAEATRLALELLDQLDEQIYWIIDFSYTVLPEKLTIPINDMIVATNSANASVWHHRNVRKLIFVTENEGLKLIAQGLNSAAFGNLDVKVFATLNDALAFARSLARKTL